MFKLKLRGGFIVCQEVINGIQNTILDQNKTNGVNEQHLLNSTIECFYKDKQMLDKYKKSTEEYNKEIKDIMSNININEFETDSGLIAKLTH